MRITCTWDQMVYGFKQLEMLKGVITDINTIRQITFETPDGQTIHIPQDSILELEIGQFADLFAVGIEHAPGSFGMTNGPCLELGEMLQVPPPDSRAVIICFDPDGKETITHRVDASGTEWEAIEFDVDDMIIDTLDKYGP